MFFLTTYDVLSKNLLLINQLYIFFCIKKECICENLCFYIKNYIKFFRYKITMKAMYLKMCRIIATLVKGLITSFRI